LPVFFLLPAVASCLPSVLQSGRFSTFSAFQARTACLFF
jgi:hypothetical protein